MTEELSLASHILAPKRRRLVELGPKDRDLVDIEAVVDIVFGVLVVTSRRDQCLLLGRKEVPVVDWKED